MEKKNQNRKEQLELARNNTEQEPARVEDDSCQYAKVNKTRINNISSKVQNNTIDNKPTMPLDENKVQQSGNDTYETIVSITPSVAMVTDKKPKTPSLSEYTIIDSSQENQHAPLREQKSDYESVSELKLDLIEEGFVEQQHDDELSPEIIAFGFHSQRLHTENQAKLFQSCLSTIDRGSRNSDKRRHFFGFGKSKQAV